jgi:methyl coenzyme M reductase subunit C-like uncharacterized protein (methanogenesis marker protein 7)
MKVNEVITEASLWDLASRASRAGKQVSASRSAQQSAQSRAQSQATPTVQTPQITRPTSPQSQLPPNVKVLASNPIVLQVDKLKFELDDYNKWHPLNRPTVDVSAGQAAILNKYLELL